MPDYRRQRRRAIRMESRLQAVPDCVTAELQATARCCRNTFHRRFSSVDASGNLHKMTGHFSQFMDKPKTSATVNITSFQHEERVFPPSKEFSKRAHIKSL